MSPSSRRAWIEILEQLVGAFRMFVALLAEGVDRNVGSNRTVHLDTVALLAESVDRNSWSKRSSTLMDKSPSSRRAWIEI